MNRLQAAFAWVLLAPAVLHAAPERSFAELLPEGTVGYLEANALSAAERDKAIAYRCLQEPEMRRALDRLMAEEGNFSRAAIPIGRGMVRLQMDIRESGAAIDVEYAHPKGTERVRFRESLAVAWVGLGEGGPFGVDAVAALQVDGDPAPAYALARRLLGALRVRALAEHAEGQPDKMERQLDEYTHGDVRCTVADFEQVQLHFAAVGSRLVIATTRDRLADVIDRSTRPAEKSLSASERFASMRERASGDGTVVMLMLLNVDRAVEQLTAHVPQLASLPAQLKLLGLGGLRAVTSTSRADGAGVSGTTSVLVEGHRVGLARLFEKDEPAKFGILAFAPQETLYVHCGRFNPQAMMRILAETAGGMVVSGVAQAVHQKTGINLYDDLVKVIGPEAAILVSSNEGLIPDLGVICESSDPARLEQSVLTALSQLKWVPGTGVFPTALAGGKAHVVKVFHPNFAQLPIAPTFGVVDGHFVATLFPISYQRFANTKHGYRPNLEKNPDYMALRKRVPADALSLSYLDVRRSVGTLYDTMIPLLQAMPQADGATPVFEMPEASLFMKHLYGRVAWAVADDRGMHWHSHSSVDLSPVAMGFAGGLAAAVGTTTVTKVENEPWSTGAAKGEDGLQVGVLVPEPAESKVGEARQCSRNVRELLQVLRFHHKRNAGFPDSLEVVAKDWVAPGTLEVPGHPGKHYRYFGPDGKGGILLAGLPNGVDGRVCVITTELDMKRISPRQLQLLLDPEETRK